MLVLKRSNASLIAGYVDVGSSSARSLSGRGASRIEEAEIQANEYVS
jgi:hypothetical protein